MRKHNPFLLALLCLLLTWSCQKESLTPALETDESHFLQLNTIEDLENFEKQLQAEANNTRSSNFGKTIILKANSHNALQDAVHAAGRYGRVILEAGNHIQEETVTINHPVYIIGKEGARLTTNIPAQVGTDALQTAFHIVDGNRVVIWGLEMINRIEGGAAIIVEDSKKAVIAKTQIHNYQIGIALEQGDQALIWKNIIRLTPKAVELGLAFGITVINGDDVKVTANTVSNALFGIWACDRNGAARFNETHNNVIGIILCNVPPTVPLESGVTGSEEPGNHWQVENNYSHDNLSTGYLVIDGANNNFLVNNRGGNNGAYDMELTTDSERFGFLTPKSYENFVDAGLFDEVSIKDCGENNLIIGGELVDTSVDACF